MFVYFNIQRCKKKIDHQNVYVSKNEKFPGKTLSGGTKLCSILLHQKSEIIPLCKFLSTLSSWDILSITTIGIIFRERRWKITFHSRAIALMRRCVFRVRSQSLRQPGLTNLYPLHSDRIHPVFEILGNSRLRARHPLSECINFSSFVLDVPCDTAAAATNAITRRVSLCFTTRRLGVYLNGLINRPEFNIELREVTERGLFPYFSVSPSHKDRRPRQSLRICLFPAQSPRVPHLTTFAQ